MKRLLAIGLRLIFVVLGYAASVLAAALTVMLLFFLISLAGLQVPWLEGPEPWLGKFAACLGFIALLTLYPSCGIVLLTEIMAIRARALFCIYGAMLGGPPLLFASTGLIFIVAGAVGGLAYWAVAGRLAGQGWRCERQPGPG